MSWRNRPLGYLNDAALIRCGWRGGDMASRYDRLAAALEGTGIEPEWVLEHVLGGRQDNMVRILAAVRKAGGRAALAHDRQLRARRKTEKRRYREDHAEGFARFGAALGKRAGTGNLETLQALAELRDDGLPEIIRLAVEGAREFGYSDPEIGAALGVTRAAVGQRFGRRHSPPERPTVYRAFAEDGRLLYIGSSNQVAQRLARHRAVSAWAADTARWEFATYPTMREARDAETAAIAAEHPEHNRTGRPASSEVESKAGFTSDALPYSAEAKAVIRAIAADMADGTVPARVQRFEELHDHVDANLYLADALGTPAEFTGQTPAEQEKAWDEFIARCDAVSDEVDRWLAAPWPRDVPVG